MGADYYTIPKLADKTGLSRDWIRAACHRGAGYHPLPHILSGEKRPVKRISYATFCAWLKEEEGLSINADEKA
jgi:hypothetical protein